jgi:hypothetical protein
MRLIRIERDFNLLGIKTPQFSSIHIDWGRTEQALIIVLAVDEISKEIKEHMRDTLWEPLST